MPAWAAVVLAGGQAARLGGVDKAGIEVGGRTLLDRTLDALVDAAEVVVVGDAVPTERPVTFVRESPRFGGPVAGLLAGVDALLEQRPLVAVVAVDMPSLTPATLRRLRVAAEDADASALVDPDGHRQLALVLQTARLAQVRPSVEDEFGMSIRHLLEPLTVVDVASQGSEHRDIDTWTDLRDHSAGPPASPTD